MKEIELKNLRKNREKHFLQEDGTIIAKVYDDDIHFKKDNEYEEIDNTLIKINDCYINRNNAYKVCFKEYTSNEIMQIQEQDYYIETSLLNNEVVKLKKEEISSKMVDCVKYENILNNIDIEYNILPTKVKENIILKDKTALQNEIVFYMRTNLQFELNEDGSISALKDNKTIFKLVTPYMYDAENNLNRNVNYSFEKVSGGYNLKLILDYNWLNSNERVFPIVIDPTITNQTQNNSVYDTYIFAGDDNVDRNNQDILKAGVERINGQDRINRALVKFDLPTIGTGSQIIEAYLQLIGYPLTEHVYEGNVVNIHRITENWDETTAKWATMNNKYDTRIESSFESLRSFIDATNTVSPMLNGGNITDLVKKWYSDTPNYGILLKENKEEYINDYVSAYYSKNNTVNGGNPQPTLILKYRNQNGLENYMDYKMHSFSRGKGFLNSYNGNLTTVFDMTSSKHGTLPLNLKLIYNTNDVILEKNFGLGLGYKFNYNQTIHEKTIDGTLYIEYEDDDGTILYFKDFSGIFKDEDGLGLEIEKDSNYYKLTNKNGDIKTFTKINDVGYLTKIEK